MDLFTRFDDVGSVTVGRHSVLARNLFMQNFANVVDCCTPSTLLLLLTRLSIGCSRMQFNSRQCSALPPLFSLSLSATFTYFHFFVRCIYSSLLARSLARMCNVHSHAQNFNLLFANRKSELHSFPTQLVVHSLYAVVVVSIHAMPDIY